MSKSNLCSFLKLKHSNSISSKTIKQYSKKTLAIDACGIISSAFTFQNFKTVERQMKHGFWKPTPTDICRNSHLISLINKVIMFNQYNIKPIWVFDGAIPIERLKTEVQRGVKKESTLRRIDHAAKKGNIESLMSFKNRAKIILPQEASNAIELLKILGHPVIEAPTQAISQCAHLNKMGVADAVVTDDQDCLAFGCKKMLKSLKSNKSLVEVNIEPFLAESEITNQEFIDFFILSGCNYTCQIPKVKPTTALKLIKQLKSIQNILPKLKIQITQQFQARFDYKRARELYNNPTIIQNPNLQFKQPNYLAFQQLLTKLQLSNKKIEAWVKRLRVSSR